MKFAQRDEAAAAAAASSLPGEVTVAFADVAGAIREGLLAFSCSAGLLVVQQIMAEEMTAKVGPKGRHLPDRAATRNGTAPGSVALGGRTVPVDRRRATLAGGGELHLDSSAVFSCTDLLTELAVERMLAGVATRRHADVAEPIGAGLEAVARGDSGSAVSRPVQSGHGQGPRRTAGPRPVRDERGSVDDRRGPVRRDTCCVAALAITAEGTKVPVGLWDGDTENTTVVKDLLADLVARGLRFEDGLLVVIDGPKPLLRV